MDRPTGQSLDRMRSLFEQFPDAVYDLDVDGRFVAGNAALARLTGHAVDDLLGRTFHDLVVPEDLPHAVEAFEGAGRGTTTRYEARGRRPGGQVYEVRVTNIPVVVDGRVVGVQGVARDVTASNATRRALERNRSLLRIAGEVARVGGWHYDAETEMVSWSEEITGILGLAPRELSGFDTGLEPYPASAREQIRAAVEACLANGAPFDIEVPAEPSPGRRMWVRLAGEAVHAADGRAVGVRGALQDIQQRRAAETERRDMVERLTAVFMGIPDAILALDREGRYTFLNRRAAALLRRDRHTLLGQVAWVETPGLAGSELEQRVRLVTASGREEAVEEFRLPHEDTWLEGTVSPLEGGVIVHLRDVTEARRARDMLRRREARLREQAELLDQARDAIVVRAADGRVTYWNRGAEVLYGWSAEDALGCRIRDLLFVDPEAHDRATAEVWRTGAWHGELEPVDREGRSHVVETRWTLVRNDDGEPQSVLEITTDVTGRRRVEELSLRARRMESLGTLASGMAHDLNNALSPILMAVQLLRTDISGQEREEILDTVEETARHGANLVEQVLSFARGVEGRRLPVDVGALVDEVARLVRDTFPPSVRWHADVADDVWHVVGDATQLHQVLVNLAVNARDAMPDGGRLDVRACNVELDELPPVAPVGSDPGAHVRIEVADAGTGMPPDVRERVFEPFFTTKDTGEGTGLGLATAHGIIESHGGFVEVESAPHRGTRFVVHLPASTDRSVPEGPRAVSGPQGRGQRILVVEDQPGVLTSAARALRANGYQVVTAEDGETAVELFTRDAEHVDLVLSDMVMPGIDGVETVRRVWRIRPDVAAVITSGLVHEAAGAAADLGVPFLPKPYGTGALLEVVASALATRAGGGH